MKRHHVLISAFLFVSIFLLACQLIYSPFQTASETPTEQVKFTDLRTPIQGLAKEPAEPVEPADPVTPTLDASIPVTGNTDSPPAELGATYPYVDGTLLVAVPAGEFIMGNDGSDSPEHVVTLNNYWIYSTKVTNQQFKLCVSLDKCSPPNTADNEGYEDPARANDPVVGISYAQAAAYCSFVGARLPTEAEWEKAARGPDGNVYPWGDIAPSCDLLNFDNCVGNTTNVITYPDGASYYGGLEFAGNTFEWVADWYDPQYYNNSPTENPTGPDTGETRSVRSSGYDSSLEEVPLSNRYFINPEDHSQNLGFRCVVELPTYFAPYCESALVLGQGVGSTASTQELNTKCPYLDIEQIKYCARKKPTTNVIFSGPPDAIIDYGDCMPTGEPNLFVCQSPGTVTISADCQVDFSRPPACSSGYIHQRNTCVGEGRRGTCLPGWNFDTERECCTPQLGQNSISKLPLCPTGNFYLAEQNTCIPYPVQELISIVSVTQEIQFQACGGSGKGGKGGDDGGGEDNGDDNCQPKDCGPYGYWDPSICGCYYYY